MSKINSQIIRELLKMRPRDLYSVMDGSSAYSLLEDLNPTKDRKELIIFKMAKDHVYFRAEYGFDKEKVKVGDRYFTTFPDHFDKWIDCGFPMLEERALLEYLEENPL